MTVKHMRIFMVVYQEMNVTRAAEKLHMTQPAVSRAIQELESYYNVRLFERINHKLYKTESGKDLYARALHVVESFDTLEKRIKDWDECGVMRIGASITLGNFFLPEVISEFREHHPNLKIKVNISNGGQLEKCLLENQLDIALIEGNVISEYLTGEMLTKDHLRLIMPVSHPLCKTKKVYMEDIIPYPFLLREDGSAGRSFLNHVFSVHGYTVEPLWESESTQALVKAVACEIGISILPEQLVRDDILNGTVATRDVVDESFTRKNFIVWHKQKFISKTTKDFISICHKFSDKNKNIVSLNSSYK